MKKTLILASLATLSVFAGCSKASNEIPATGDCLSFTVLNEDTKTYGLSTIQFNSNDSLSVFDSALANNGFGQVAVASGAEMDFKGTVTASSTADYVVYPWNKESTVAADGTITVPIASTITANNSNSILPKMNLSVGVLDGEGKVSLKNVFGIVGVDIPASCYYCIKSITLSADQALAGKVSFKYNGGEPVVTGISEESKSVTFTPKAGTAKLPVVGAYYFCVAPGTYTGVKLTITLLDGRTKEFASSNSLVVARNSRTMLRRISLSDVQSAPAGDLTLSLDFNTNILNLPTTATAVASAPKGYTFVQDGYYYPICFCGINISDSKKAKFRYYADESYLALQLYYVGTAVIAPALPGKKLSQFRFMHSNGASKKDVTMNLVYYNQAGQNGETLKNSYPDNVATSTRLAGEDPSFGEWLTVTAEKDAPVFIYCAESSNVCIRQIEFKYVDAE